MTDPHPIYKICRPGGVAALTLVLLLLSSGCIQSLPGEDGSVNTLHKTGSSLILYTEEQPPLNYIDQKGDISGSSVAIVTEIMNRLDLDAPIHLVSWTKGYNTVLTTPGTALFSTTLTHPREPMFKWVGPIASAEYTFFGRDDFSMPVSSFADVKKAGLIAVVGNTGRHLTLQSSHVDNLLICEDDKECIEAVLSGKAALWFGTKDMYSQTAKRLSSEMNRIVEVWPFMQRGLYIAFNRDTPDSEIQKWQQVLDEMKSDGTYDMIIERYMPYICSWVKCTP